MTDTLQAIVAEMGRYAEMDGHPLVRKWADRLAALSGSAGEAVALGIWAGGRNPEAGGNLDMTLSWATDDREKAEKHAAMLRGRGWAEVAIRPLYTHPARVDLEGWVMVPREPTPDMDKAGATERDLFDPQHNSEIVAIAIYRAMLAAAPRPAR